MRSRGELVGVDPAEWAAAKRRERVLRPLVERGGQLETADLANAATALGVSGRWLRTLLDRFRCEPRTSTLLCNAGGRPSGHTALTLPVEQIVSEQLDSFYATTQRPRLMDLVDAIHHACRKAGLPPPTRKTISRRVKAPIPGHLLRSGRAERRPVIDMALSKDASPRLIVPWGWSKLTTRASISSWSTRSIAVRSVGHG